MVLVLNIWTRNNDAPGCHACLASRTVALLMAVVRTSMRRDGSKSSEDHSLLRKSDLETEMHTPFFPSQVKHYLGRIHSQGDECSISGQKSTPQLSGQSSQNDSAELRMEEISAFV